MAHTEFEVRTGGSDLNGGGFLHGASGINRAQQDSPHVTFDGSTVTATHPGTTTVITITGYTVSNDDIGNWLNVSGGTNFVAGLYRITAVNTGANTWTLHASPSNGSPSSGMTGRMGGAFGSPGMLTTAMPNSGAGQDTKGWIKAGTYTLTTSTAGSGGPISFTQAGQSIEGFENTHGDLSTNRPILDVGAISSFTVVTSNGGNSRVANIEVDGQGLSSVVGFTGGSTTIIYKCYARDCATGFTGSSSAVTLFRNKAEGCTTGFATSQALSFCESINCTTGYSPTGNCTVNQCVARGGTTGFLGNSTQIRFVNCTAKGCSGDGFDAGNATPSFVNCAATHNGGFGFDINSRSTLINCAGYSNTSGNVDASPDHGEYSFVTLTADPWVSSTDLRPNFTSGGGAALRANGIGVSDYTSLQDIGALQHEDLRINAGIVTGGALGL